MGIYPNDRFLQDNVLLSYDYNAYNYVYNVYVESDRILLLLEIIRNVLNVVCRSLQPGLRDQNSLIWGKVK